MESVEQEVGSMSGEGERGGGGDGVRGGKRDLFYYLLCWSHKNNN